MKKKNRICLGSLILIFALGVVTSYFQIGGKVRSISKENDDANVNTFYEKTNENNDKIITKSNDEIDSNIRVKKATTSYVATLNGTGYTSFDSAISAFNNTNNSTLILQSNVSISTNYSISKSGTIDLNGYIISASSSYSSTSALFTIWTGTINLVDSNPNKVHYYTVNSDGLYVVSDTKSSSSQEIYGGIITGFKTASLGGVFAVYNPVTLNLNGGSIVGNYASANGGAIYSASSSDSYINVNKCLIAGNSSPHGGGILSYGNLTVNDGAVISNNTSKGDGAGIWSQGIFKMTGGTIENNTASGSGGGIELCKNGLSNYGFTSTITGGTIQNNTASGGGGIYVYNGHTLNLSNVNIINNVAKSNGGGVCLASGGILNLSGTPNISGNTKTNGTTKSNLYIASSSYIPSISTTLSKDAYIGVTSGFGTGTLATGMQFDGDRSTYAKVTDYDISKFYGNSSYTYELLKPFYYDTSSYAIYYNTSTQCYEVTEHIHTKVTLTNKINSSVIYTCNDLDGATCSYVNKVSDPTLAGWTFGDTANKPSATATYGTVDYYYSSSADGTYSSTQPTNAGTYYVVALVESTSTYGGAISNPVKFTIAPKSVDIVWNNDDALSYNGKDQSSSITPYYLDVKGNQVDVSFTLDGEFMNGGDYEVNAVTPCADPNYTYSSSTTTATYTIKKLQNEITSFTIEDIIYDQDILDPQATTKYPAAVNYYFANTSDSTLTFKDEIPVNAGTYKVKVVAVENGGYLSATYYDEDFTVTIAKASVDKPSAYNHTYVYSGETLTYHIAESDYYYVTDNQKVNAGTYTVYVYLNDPDNYAWDDGSLDTLTYTFVINKAQATISELRLTSWQYGQTPNSPSAYTNLGSISYSYSTSENGTFTSQQPSDVGTYYVKAEVKGTSNYVGDVQTIPFKITSAEAIIIWNNQNAFYYNGEDHYSSIEAYYLDVSGNKIKVDTETQILIEAATYKIYAVVESPNYDFTNSYAYYVVSDVNNVLKDFDIESWIVGQEPNAPTGTATFGIVTFTYASSEDGPYSSSVPTAAGSYYVKAYVQGTTSYSAIEQVLPFSIYKREIDDPVVGTLNYTYTGKNIVFDIEKSGYYSLSDNVKLNVGSYEVTVSLLDKDNYIWASTNNSEDLTYYFTINSGSNSVYDLTLKDWTYGENPQIPSAKAKFGVVRYAYSTSSDGAYTSTVPSSAGTYYVKAFVRGNANYDEAYAVTTFTIYKATTKITDFSIDENLTYGNNLASLDAVSNFGTIVYTYSTTKNGVYTKVIPTLAGTYFVKAEVASSRDYEGAVEYLEFTIAKKEIAIPSVTTTTYTYTGKNITFASKELAYSRYYKVSNNVKLNVGTYEVSVSLLDTANTTWVGGSSADQKYTFEIVASEENAITSLKIASWAEGDDPSEPEGKATFGIVQFLYASDKDGTYTQDMPSKQGTYYLKGYVKATDNYPACESIIEFEITEPSENPVLKANEITSLSLASWSYGDAASSPVISATHGADTATYTYSTSEDGTYTSTLPTNAGTYYLKATIAESTKDRYLGAEKIISFTITRKKIAKPEEDKTVYYETGSLIVYQVEDNDAYQIEDNGHTSYGEYSVHINLKDKNNYEWDDGTTDDLYYKFTINAVSNNA